MMRFSLIASCLLLVLITATPSTLMVSNLFFAPLKSRRESDVRTKKFMYHVIVQQRERHAGRSFKEWPEVDRMTYRGARDILIGLGERMPEELDVEESEQ